MMRGSYYEAVRSRPALLVAITMIISIVLLRMVLVYATGSVDGYDRDDLNNPFYNLDIEEGQLVTVEGKVNSIQVKETEWSGITYGIYLSDVKYLGTRVTRPWEKIVVTVDDLESLKIGQILLVDGKLRYHDKPTNWGEFDSYGYYSNRGIVCRLDKADIVAWGEEYNRLEDGLWRLRQKADKYISSVYGEEDGAILKAMLLGNKGEIPERIKNAFQKCGIAHILAISGLHISFLCISIYRLLDKLGIKRWINILVSEVMMILYVVMVGLNASSVRAAIMFSLFIISTILKRSYDIITGTAVSAIIILGFNPWNLWDMSFQLSFLAIIGISVCNKMFLNNSIYLKRVLKKRDSTRLSGKLYNTILVGGMKNLVAGIFVFLVTLPVLLWGYYEAAAYSVVLNLVIVPLMPVLLVTAVAGLALTALVGEIGYIFVYTSKLILALYKGCCIYLEETGMGRYNFGKPKWWMIVLFYFFLIVFCTYKNNKAVVIKGLCLLSALFVLRADSDGIYMLDVGQGDCIVVINNRNVYVMDGGSTSKKSVGTNVIIPFLKSCGVNEIEAVFISHPDEDHINGIYELVSNGKTECLNIKKIYVYLDSLIEGQYQELLDITEESDIQVCGIKAGNELYDDSLRFTCIYPQSGISDNSNDNSVVLRVEMGGLSLLETGDLEVGGEQKLLDKAINADIIKVAHHGSSTSTSRAFIEAVTPKLALISAGRNNKYGHPHKETIDELVGSNIAYLSTIDSGAIRIRAYKNGIKVETFM